MYSVFAFVAAITPAGTYFNLKLAMLLSLVAEAHEVLTGPLHTVVSGFS